MRRNNGWNYALRFEFNPAHPELTRAPVNVAAHAWLKYWSEMTKQLAEENSIPEKERAYEPT